MAIKFIRKRGMLVLCIWLIAFGLMQLYPIVKSPVSSWNILDVVMAVLPVVAGVLLLIDW